jgi:hypothetical protein
MLLAATYGTISDIEIAWVFIAIVGLFFSGWTCRESHKDVRALRASGIANGRMLIATTSRFQDAARVAIHSIFIVVGITAMFIPDADVSALPLPMLIAGVAIRWGLIIAALLLVSQSYVANRLRRTLVHAEFERKIEKDARAEWGLQGAERASQTAERELQTQERKEAKEARQDSQQR